MVNEYKLIKWYPGLPSHWKNNKPTVRMNGSFFFAYDGTAGIHKDIVINHPEFWKEIVDETVTDEYIILSYKGDYTDNIYRRDNGGKYYTSDGIQYNEHADDISIYSVERKSDGQIFTVGDNIVSNSFNDTRSITEIFINNNNELLFRETSNISDYGGLASLENIKKANGYKVLELESSHNPTSPIVKIRRLSDGEVFSIGDKVRVTGGGPQTIERFEIAKESIRFRFEDGRGALLSIFIDPEEIVHYKKPLVVTDDGVEIFEGDQYFEVRGDNTYYSSFIAGQESPMIEHSDIRLSTKKAAEEYIELHRLQYSKADIKRVASKLDNHYEKVNSTIGDLLLREFLLD